MFMRMFSFLRKILPGLNCEYFSKYCYIILVSVGTMLAQSTMLTPKLMGLGFECSRAVNQAGIQRID